MTAVAPIAAGIGMLSSAAGGLFGAAGAQYQGQAQANMYNYQAGVAQVNAVLAKQDANYAVSSGLAEGQQTGLRYGQVLGQQRAGFGASNVTGGSQASVSRSETTAAQTSEGTVQSNAAKRAYGFETTAAGETAQAGADTVAAQTSLKAGQIGAISSLIGGAGSVSSKWMQASQSFGTFNPFS